MKSLITSLVSILLSFHSPAYSQSQSRAQAKGSVHDSLTGNWLPDATITLLTNTDSTIIRISQTDQSGKFQLDSLTPGNYILKASFVGYNSINQHVKIPFGTNKINFGSISLERMGITLSQIEVVQSRKTAKIKNDTIEFNANNFKSNKTDMMEDLLKKIPILQIDNNGSIRVNGKEVKYLMINGRPIFNGEDLKLISQNLLAGIADKIQIINPKEDQKLSTQKTPSGEIAINIITKQSIQNSINGLVSGAAGTSSRFGVKTNINQFAKDHQTIFLASGDNINGLLDAQYIQNTGLETKWKSGINFNKNINKNTLLSASYLIQKNEINTEVKSTRQTFIGDTISTYNQQSVSQTDNTTQRFSSQFEHNFDSLLKISITNQITLRGDNKNFHSEYESFSTDLGVKNIGSINNSAESNSSSFNSSIYLEKKFLKERRAINLLLGYSSGITKDNSKNKSINSLDNSSNEAEIDTTYFNIQESRTRKGFFLKIDYSEPISENSILVFNFGEEHVSQPQKRELFNFNYTTKKFDILNDSLSSIFRYTYYQRYGRIGWTNQMGKIDYTISLAAILSGTDNDDKISSERIKNNKTGVIPNILMKYSFTNSKYLKFSYIRGIRFPLIDEVQPVTDISNPLYIKKGNANLKPSWSENFNISYNTFNPEKFSSFSLSLNATFISNEIVAGATIDSIGRQIIQSLNLNGASNFGLYLYGDIPLGNKIGSFKISTNMDVNNDLNYLNGVKGRYQNIVIGQSLSYNYDYKNTYKLSLNLYANYNSTKYLTTYSNPNKNLNYGISIDNIINIPGDLIVSNTTGFNWISGNSVGYNNKSIIVNASISKPFISRKKGLLKLQVYDLLNKNFKNTRTIGGNYVEESQSNLLQRFFLLKFTYIIGK